MLLSGKMGVSGFWISGFSRLVEQGFQEYNLASLNMKKPMSPTPLKCVRRALMRIFPVGELGGKAVQFGVTGGATTAEGGLQTVGKTKHQQTRPQRGRTH